MTQRRTRRQNSDGFTIVELLIVIVVIGILAALALNSFAGAQQKARNAQTLTAIAAYKKAMFFYLAENGKYPDMPGQNTACLGEGWPDTNADGVGDCFSSIIRSEHAGVNDALRPYLERPMPRANDRLIRWGDEDKRGAFMLGGNTELTVDNIPTPQGFQYYMEGLTRCGPGALRGDSSRGGFPYMLSDNPNGHSGQRNGNTRCIVALPNP